MLQYYKGIKMATPISQKLYGKQIQTQKMLPNQIMAVKMLSYKVLDLRDEILKEVENNPALEIVSDPMANEPAQNFSYSNSYKTSEDTDAFQKMLENQQDERETLQDHLISQLNMQNISPVEFDACQSLIYNLDSKGFHILSPYSLKGQHYKEFSKDTIQKALKIIQHFDPIGICVKDFEESLKVQAEILMQEEKIDINQNKLILFILDGRFSFLDPLEIPKIQKKIINWVDRNFSSEIINKDQLNSYKSYEVFDKKYVTENRILNALTFIKKLNPFPASDFLSVAETNFVKADVKVTFEKGSLESDDLEKGLISYSENEFIKVSLVDDTLPEITISKAFTDSLNSKKIDKNSTKMLKSNLSRANYFINLLNFRKKITFDTLVKIVSIQKEFFKNGAGYLVPLTQKELAQKQNISESTVSRMSDSKFILCDSGLFPMKNFFSRSIHKNSQFSSDLVKMKILEIIKNNPGKLSDQKISDLLKEKGYDIARRTVAKYRMQLNVSSSFKR